MNKTDLRYILFLSSLLMLNQCNKAGIGGTSAGGNTPAADSSAAANLTGGTNTSASSVSTDDKVALDPIIPLPLPIPEPPPADPVSSYDVDAFRKRIADENNEALRQLALLSSGATSTNTNTNTTVAAGTVTQTTVASATAIVTATNTQTTTTTSITAQSDAQPTNGIHGNDGSAGINPFYQKILDNSGITIVSDATVDDEALLRAQYVVNTMLKYLPDVKQSMQNAKFRVNIIARKQIVTDLPDFSYLTGVSSTETGSVGMAYSSLRALGGRTALAVGEENLLCDSVQPFWSEDVSVHEFAHSIKMHMTSQMSGRIDAAYNSAVANHLYTPGIYMMANSQEYWAEATQSWFGVTLRIDVNNGYNTRAKLTPHDPTIIGILNDVFQDVLVLRYSVNCVY